MSKTNQHRNEVCPFELEQLREEARTTGADEIVMTTKQQVWKVQGKTFTDEASALKAGLKFLKIKNYDNPK